MPPPDEPEEWFEDEDEPSPFDQSTGDEESEAEASSVQAPAPAIRHESLRQRGSFASSGWFDLHVGPRMRVRAKAILIHGKTKGPRINLQIVKETRTKYLFPEWEQAKDAYIGIEGPEVEELYARLTEARQNLGVRDEGGYLVVRTGSEPDLNGLEALMRMVANNPGSFVPLTEMVATEQIDALRAVVNIGRFKKAKHELEQLIAENPPEERFQKWFEENDWVFGSEYVERLSKQNRRIAADSIIDLMFLAVDGFADIFELKRPGVPVFVQTGGRDYYIPSADLNAAFGQAVHYLNEADNNAFINQVTRDLPIYRPRVRLVIGRSNEWSDAQHRVYRETSAAWSRIELLTYDMVLKRIDLLVKTMSRELRAKAAEPEVIDPFG